MQATEPEHGVVSQWLRAIDLQTWGKLPHLLSSATEGRISEASEPRGRGYFTRQAVLVNVVVKPHRDTNDDRGGRIATNCVGSFGGGNAVFPELKARLRQEAGDLMFSKSAALEHWIRGITEGQQFGNARFMKANILNPPQPTFLCDCGCVDRRYTTRRSSVHHYQTSHPVEWAAEHPGWFEPVKLPRKRP